MTYEETLLQVLADAIKRATGASLNQSDVATELDRIKAAYAPPVPKLPSLGAQAPGIAIGGGAWLRPSPHDPNIALLNAGQMVVS